MKNDVRFGSLLHITFTFNELWTPLKGWATQIDGVSSFCRFWHLETPGYLALLHLFRSSAWSLTVLFSCWWAFVLSQQQTVMVEGQAVMSIGFQLKHKATCSGGGRLTRHSHSIRVRLGGIPIWRVQCTTCKAVFTVLPHFVLRYRQRHPEVARNALLAPHGGLSLELGAMICHVSPMAIYRLVCALGRRSMVSVLTRCGLPLPVYFLADEKHTHCLTDKIYLPTIVSGRVIWHLG